MSEFKVPITKILDIQPHSNAHSLEIATVYGFQVVIPKEAYKVGDSVLYVPIDSILPVEIEEKIFGPGSKIKLHHHRVKQIRIRGFASQGMIVNPSTLGITLCVLEFDYAGKFGIAKYEPIARGSSQNLGKDKQRLKREDHPQFHKYNGVESIKWFPTLFKEGEEVVIQEKLHGSNVRAACLPYNANTWWKRIKRAFRFAPEWECVYGSNNVEISSKPGYLGFYGEDIYGAVLKKVDAFNKIYPNEIIYGEIIGPGIQKNYDYGHKEHHFVLFDVKVFKDGKWSWLSPEAAMGFARARGFDFVPVVYVGPYNKEQAYALTKGNSVYCPKQKVTEGIVIKSRNEYSTDLGNRKAVKWISEEYLDKDQTDFH